MEVWLCQTSLKDHSVVVENTVSMVFQLKLVRGPPRGACLWLCPLWHETEGTIRSINIHSKWRNFQQ
jgi:hypothetical protein